MQSFRDSKQINTFNIYCTSYLLLHFANPHLLLGFKLPENDTVVTAARQLTALSSRRSHRALLSECLPSSTGHTTKKLFSAEGRYGPGKL